MTHLMFFGDVLLTSLLFALVEIQIEGPDGWAARLPTWRVDNNWTRWLLGRKPLTGYHLYAAAFIAALLHFPYALSLVSFSWKTEFRILSFMVLFWIIEDFLWFVCNPHFGLQKFRPQFIWWHAPSWWWVVPRDYVLFTPVGLLLYYLSL